MTSLAQRATELREKPTEEPAEPFEITFIHPPVEHIRKHPVIVCLHDRGDPTSIGGTEYFLGNPESHPTKICPGTTIVATVVVHTAGDVGGDLVTQEELDFLVAAVTGKDADIVSVLEALDTLVNTRAQRTSV